MIINKITNKKYMRQLLASILIILFLTNCKQKKIQEHHIQTKFYSTARVKEILVLNYQNVKDGKCFYFDENGYLDSTVEYSNGIVEGYKNKYYEKYGRYSYEYKNGIQVKERFYDTLDVLRYETPLDMRGISKTEIYINSNKNYIDRNHGDTVRIINKGLPSYNRELLIDEGSIQRLDQDTYIIKPNKDHPKRGEFNLIISVRQNLSDSTEKSIPFDTTIIKVK